MGSNKQKANGKKCENFLIKLFSDFCFGCAKCQIKSKLNNWRIDVIVANETAAAAAARRAKTQPSCTIFDIACALTCSGKIIPQKCIAKSEAEHNKPSKKDSPTLKHMNAYEISYFKFCRNFKCSKCNRLTLRLQHRKFSNKQMECGNKFH